jgi:membrane protease YdiL (CAAX protease family)
MKKKILFPVLAASLLCCAVMTVVDGLWQPGYVIKSLVKVSLFLLIPFLCSLFHRGIAFRSLFRVTKKGFCLAVGLGLAVFGVILGGYFLLSPYFDFSKIASSLTASTGVDKSNFLFVALYISFVNSLLEEVFFRGFVFTNLKTSCHRWFAHGFSALLFSLYHTAMMLGWFSLPLFLLVLVGLAVGGVIFNLLNEKGGTIFVSWIVHMFANFAINTIGFLLLK